MRLNQVWKATTSRKGVIAVFVAVSLVGILGVVAISFDGGGMMSERRHAQAVADAAALAGASDLFEKFFINDGADPGDTALKSALKVAADNGYTNDEVTSKVTVNIPPKEGRYTGLRGYVEVIVEYYFQRSFSNIFAQGAIPIRARAVALGAPIAADVGILVLDPHKRASFNAQGGGTTDVKGTPIVVNSDHNEAAIAGGGAILKAQKFTIKGSYTTTGGAQFIGPIYDHRPGIEDPFKDLAPPNPNLLTKQSNKKYQYTSGDHYLKPGVYKGGIDVSGTGNLYLEPGIYYMDNGGFQFKGQGSLEGKGVLIYTNPGNGQAQGVDVQGQGSMILYGMKEGPYHGITFWQRRDANVTGNVAGTGGATDITGTFYFAGALLNISGNGGVSNIGSQYISRELYLGGTGSINIDWEPDKVGRKRSIHLVE